MQKNSAIINRFDLRLKIYYNARIVCKRRDMFEIPHLLGGGELHKFFVIYLFDFRLQVFQITRLVVKSCDVSVVFHLLGSDAL